MLKTSRGKTLLTAALLLALASPLAAGSVQAAGTESQAVRNDASSAVTSVLGEERVHHEGHREGHHARKHHRRLNDMAEALGMTSSQLIEELKKGKSVAQIGKSKGISEDQLIGKLLDKERVHLKEQINRSWTAEAKKNT
ncbi:hypothetical protein [Cohnella sp. JJ-181]|uniref:hypothetical protein n=1 Tax=Cohnella rhizoplanae TaxID=2974897 RepID=UPI0022FF7DC6|nr:hypothetical protein [Cohnella sp. JJ-181]CAI6021493.1 hypothetical protein COHCIP112018_00330 [Cohnella sp. JJ-181]